MIGKKIKRLREEKSISARELSRRSGVSQGYLSQLETGKNNNPTNDVLKRLTSVLGVIEDASDSESNIRRIRLRLGLTMEEFGNKFNPPASKSLVSRWERGVNSPNIERLRELDVISQGTAKNELINFTTKELIDELRSRDITLNEFIGGSDG